MLRGHLEKGPASPPTQGFTFSSGAPHTRLPAAAGTPPSSRKSRKPSRKPKSLSWHPTDGGLVQSASLRTQKCSSRDTDASWKPALLLAGQPSPEIWVRMFSSSRVRGDYCSLCEQLGARSDKAKESGWSCVQCSRAGERGGKIDSRPKTKAGARWSPNLCLR